MPPQCADRLRARARATRVQPEWVAIHSDFEQEDVVDMDDHDSTSNAVFVSQGGLSLPSRDYYIDKDIETDPTLQALVNHIANANHLADPATVPSAAAYFPQAAAIVALESSLATAQLSRVAMRDPEVLREPSPFLSHFYKCYTETHKINKTCSGQT